MIWFLAVDVLVGVVGCCLCLTLIILWLLLVCCRVAVVLLVRHTCYCCARLNTPNTTTGPT